MKREQQQHGNFSCKVCDKSFRNFAEWHFHTKIAHALKMYPENETENVSDTSEFEDDEVEVRIIP